MIKTFKLKNIYSISNQKVAFALSDAALNASFCRQYHSLKTGLTVI